MLKKIITSRFTQDLLMVLFAKNGPLWGLKSPKITQVAKKMQFFKLQDIDTIIETGEKEYQFNISSASKRVGGDLV